MLPEECICPLDFNHNRGHSSECHRHYKLLHLSELSCDVCGKIFGYCYDFDLNGSLFVCNFCNEQIEKEKK